MAKFKSGDAVRHQNGKVYHVVHVCLPDRRGVPRYAVRSEDRNLPSPIKEDKLSQA